MFVQISITIGTSTFLEKSSDSKFPIKHVVPTHLKKLMLLLPQYDQYSLNVVKQFK